MIDTKYRKNYQFWVLGPFLRSSWIQNLQPKWITFCALFCGVLVGVFLFLHLPILAFLFLVFSGFLDTLDGALARRLEKTSPMGAVLDITSDRIVEFAIVLGLFFVFPEERGLPCLLLLGSILLCITTFLVVGIFSQMEGEKSFYYSPGIMERTEAFIFFSAMILFPQAFLFLAIIFFLLVSLTAILRIYQFFSCSS